MVIEREAKSALFAFLVGVLESNETVEVKLAASSILGKLLESKGE